MWFTNGFLSLETGIFTVAEPKEGQVTTGVPYQQPTAEQIHMVRQVIGSADAIELDDLAAMKPELEPMWTSSVGDNSKSMLINLNLVLQD